MYLIQPLTYSFYPPYVSTLSPQSLWITAEKVDKSVKKRFSHQEVGKSSEKRGFYISFPKKCLLCIMPYFAPLWTSLDHLRITLCTCCIHYNNISLLYFICNDFSHFYYLLSQLFGFQVLFSLLYLYIVVLHPFITTLLWYYPSCTGLCFFLFYFRSFDVETSFSADNSFFAAQLYIGISPIILFKNLTLFMCSNLLVRHYYLSCLCLYRLSLCKNKYVS